MNLPEHIINKIMLYVSHPVADIVKKSTKFKLRKHRIESTRGCPFDRGGADAYYGRNYCPHKVAGRVKDKNGKYYNVRVEEEHLTEEELEAYRIGFVFWDGGLKK